MALIQNIDQFRQHVGLNSSADNDTYTMLLPDLLLQEDEQLRPLLGDAFYDEFTTLVAADGTVLEPEQTMLLTLLQSPLANLTMLSYSDLAQVQISGAGFMVTADSTQRPAAQWQVNNLKNNWRRKGNNGLEKVLLYLARHATNPLFQTWADAETTKAHRGHFISSAATFSEHYDISNERLTFRALQSIIRKTEALTLEPLLSRVFFRELREQLSTGALTAENKELVTDYIQPALAHLVIAQSIGELSFSLNGNALEFNVYRPDDSNSKEADPGLETLLAMKAEQALADGEQFIRRLRKHLNNSASAERYATYFTSPAYEAPRATDFITPPSQPAFFGAF